jgi:hypothetical protein
MEGIVLSRNLVLVVSNSSPRRHGMGGGGQRGIGGGGSVTTWEEAAGVALIGVLSDLGASWGRGSGRRGKYGRGGGRG